MATQKSARLTARQRAAIKSALAGYVEPDRLRAAVEATERLIGEAIELQPSEEPRSGATQRQLAAVGEAAGKLRAAIEGCNEAALYLLDEIAIEGSGQRARMAPSVLAESEAPRGQREEWKRNRSGRVDFLTARAIAVARDLADVAGHALTAAKRPRPAHRPTPWADEWLVLMLGLTWREITGRSAAASAGARRSPFERYLEAATAAAGLGKSVSAWRRRRADSRKRMPRKSPARTTE